MTVIQAIRDSSASHYSQLKDVAAGSNLDKQGCFPIGSGERIRAHAHLLGHLLRDVKRDQTVTISSPRPERLWRLAAF
jgi:hypothetical protein